MRSTLNRLASDPRVHHVDAGKVDTLRSELRGLVRAMDGVTLEPVTSASFSRLQLGRNDRAYALPLAVCRLVFDLEMPSEETGDHALAALLRDQIRLSSLFERFVRNFWRYHLEEFEVKQEVLSWGDELGNPLVPGMHTDITLVRRAPPNERLIVDTKFYGNTLSAGQHGQLRFHSGNLYQLYAYLRTQEHRGESFRTAEGMLLYPTTSSEFDESMKVQGHRIRVATVDLRRPWPAIHDRLLRLPLPTATGLATP